MRVFVAGGTGVVGQRLVQQLVTNGHRVTATTTGAGKLGLLKQLGADAVVMNGLDRASVTEAVAKAQPDVIVHEMTAIAGTPNLRHMDRWFATTNQLRIEGTDNLLVAARTANVSHVVAQSYGAWNGIRSGGRVKTEQDPLDMNAGTNAQGVAEAIRHLETVVTEAGGAVVRYGWLYGAGATSLRDLVEALRKRQFPLVGGGTGYTSWVHVDDAARATVSAVEKRATGVFNIVDDDPAPVSEWLPYLAACAGAKPPMRVPAWLARVLAGEIPVIIMTEGRAFSNTKAKQVLGWQPHYTSWRQGFEAELMSGGTVKWQQ